MALYPRGSTWWIDFTTSSGQRIRRSTATADKPQAQHLHDKLKAESWREDFLDIKPLFTWDEAAHRWLSETTKRTRNDDILKLRWLQQFLRGKVLAHITGVQIEAIGKAKLAVSSKSTVNRYLQLIKAILNKARREEWISKVPTVTLYEEPEGRERWITPAQATTLLSKLPDHQRAMAEFALLTGLRQGNVTALQWMQIDMERRTVWIPKKKAKKRKGFSVPLNDLAIEILQRQLGKHPDRVFTYEGMPITWVNTRCWRHALRRAGIHDFRWHDLRHTWATWHIQNGTSIYELKELGGWETIEMVERYAHLGTHQMASRSAVVSNLLRATRPVPSRIQG